MLQLHANLLLIYLNHLTGWNDSRNKGENAVLLGNGQPCDASAMAFATTLMDDLAVSLKVRGRERASFMTASYLL